MRPDIQSMTFANPERFLGKFHPNRPYIHHWQSAFRLQMGTVDLPGQNWQHRGRNLVMQWTPESASYLER